MADDQAASATIVPTVDLNDGNKIPVIAFGTKDVSGDVQQTVNDAVEVGFRHFVTMFLYDNEDEIGKAIGEVIEKGLVKREDLFMTTTLWFLKHGSEEVQESLKVTLSRLGVDYVDLCVVPDFDSTNEDGTPRDVDFLDTWKGLEEAKSLGLVKSIGVCNFDTEQVKSVIENSQTPPAVNLLEVHPSHTREALVSDMEELGIKVMAFSPLGFLVEGEVADAPAPHSDDPILTEIGEKYDKSTTQIVLRYLLDRGIMPFPESIEKEQLQQNIDVFDFTLTPEEIDTINNFNVNKTVIDHEND